MKYKFCVYIHSNNFNKVPATVAMHSFKKNNNGLEVFIENLEDHEKILKYHNSIFYRKGKKLKWDSEKHQSFFPVRFLCVESHKLKKREYRWILVVDPDVFAIRDISILNDYINEAESKEKNIISHKGESSVMLIDTHKIEWTEDFLIHDMFENKNDFDNWMYIKNSDFLEIPVNFNEKDKINKNTYLLHTTCTETQPWKTGIKYYDYELNNKIESNNPKKMEFKDHKDKNVKYFVFNMFKSAYEEKLITINDIEYSILNKHLREDILKICGII